NPDGTALVYSTYLGGSDFEFCGSQIAVDSVRQRIRKRHSIAEERYMNLCRAGKRSDYVALIFLVCCCLVVAGGQQPQGVLSTPGSQATEPANLDLIQPEELVNILKLPRGTKPLVIQVGFHILYAQSHIPGSEYVGPSSSPDGIGQLRNRVASLPRTQFIVLYCGCCPWSKCPNVSPAYKQLHGMGFKNVKVLYIANNFGSDWVDKGYPVTKGE